jgi:predicted RNase H-like HicB family nuclease
MTKLMSLPRVKGSDGVEIRFTLSIHEEDGSFWAEVRELPGCFAAGKDFDELNEAVAEAIQIYLSDENGQIPLDRIRELIITDADQDETKPAVDLSEHRRRRRSQTPRLHVSEMQAHMRLDRDIIEA